jgi:Tol biopolymer transport system component
MKKFYQDGFPIVIFISHDDITGFFVWRLYDTARAQMQVTGIIQCEQLSKDSLGAVLGDVWWRSLTGSEPLFSTFIAFCTETTKSHAFRDLEIVPFGADFSERKKVVRSKKLLMPRWYPDKTPLLFYSEITQFNIRLVSLQVSTGKKMVVVNTKGSSFAPSYCPSGTSLVYCHSKEGASQLHRFNSSGLLPLSFKNNAATTFLSPTLCDNGDIIFCSDAQGKLQVFHYDAAKEHVSQLTFGAPAQCPDYCLNRNEIVFVRPVKGVSQLFLLSCKDSSVKQLTFDAGSKDECHWSPEGHYIVYAHNTNGTSRIACFNCATHESFFITGAHERCVHPSWSFN